MLLLSIHPRFATAIFDGTKTIELRRRAPKLAGGDKVIVYATVPRAEVIGSFTVESVVSKDLESLWHASRNSSSVTKSEFNAYFDGLSDGVGIWVQQTMQFPTPISLNQLRKLWPGFHPPQGFRYLTDPESRKIEKLGLSAAKRSPRDGHPQFRDTLLSAKRI